jgi:hypothetical protein
MPAEERAERLRLMLVRPADLPADGISAQLNKELAGMLVAMGPDDPYGAPPAYGIPAHLTPRWNATPSDLINRAIANLEVDQLEVNANDYAPETVMYVISRPDLVSAGHLLRLEEAVGTKFPHGAFVVVPKANAVCVLPLHRAEQVSLIDSVLRLVHGSASEEAPSQDVFWFHGGKLDPLNVQVKRGKMERIFPPDGFNEMLAQLPR